MPHVEDKSLPIDFALLLFSYIIDFDDKTVKWQGYFVFFIKINYECLSKVNVGLDLKLLQIHACAKFFWKCIYLLRIIINIRICLKYLFIRNVKEFYEISFFLISFYYQNLCFDLKEPTISFH